MNVFMGWSRKYKPKEHMQRKLLFTYLILAALFTFYATIQEIQPALFFIDIMAPNSGDTYSVTLTLLLTFLLFLAPIVLIQLVMKTLRKKPDKVVGPNRTGVFVTRQKRLQSALLGIPVFINSKKVGIVENGETAFFDVPSGEL